MTIKKMDEIWNAVYAEPCVLDFDTLDMEECSFAIGVIISAGSRGEFKTSHFNEKQLEFLKKATESLSYM